MEGCVSEIIESIMKEVFKRNSDESDQCSVFDFSQMSQKLSSDIVDGEVFDRASQNFLVKSSTGTEVITSPQFTAADIFSDLEELSDHHQAEKSVEQPIGRATGEMATQTSQSLLGTFFDATAQTSQVFLVCNREATEVAAQTSQAVLLDTSTRERQIQLPAETHRRQWSALELCRDWDEDNECDLMRDQVVPVRDDSVSTAMNYFSSSRLKIRRIGLSKRARLNPLHSKKSLHLPTL